MLAVLCSAHAADVDFARLLNAHSTPQDWLTHHGSYRSWHYSALEQINQDNVHQLKVAWLHTPSASAFGVRSMPLVADGVLYYITTDYQIWALRAADGSRLWEYKDAQPALTRDEPGLALTGSKVLFASGGELIALERDSGNVAWRQTLIDTKQSKYRLAGAPLVVKDKAIIGAYSAGVADCCGPIFAVSVNDGVKLWQFDSVARVAQASDATGTQSQDNIGGGARLTGSYDVDSNTVWIGTAAPAPRFDWAGGQWRSEGARPGDNLFTSSVIALNADTGKLVSYFQEVPHDVWGFDAADGEHVLFERDGKRYVLHPNKSGFVYVYERDTSIQPLRPANIWRLSKYSNFVHSINANTGAMVGRRDLPLGKHVNVCPSGDGAIGAGAGAFSARAGMYYKVAREWCSNIELTQLANADARLPPHVGRTWQLTAPPGHGAFGHLSARDPLSGALIWEREYAYPPVASLLATGGNLLFVPHADGRFEALDARTGKTLWTHNNGLAHEGGVITYAVHGKQYVAVVTGWGGEIAGSYAKLWGEPFRSMPTDTGQLIVFALP
jgi:PQQ-dependent dehydrogenase (methanol/ethanol family)